MVLGQSEANPVEPMASTTTVQTVKERVSEFFKDEPIMIRIAWCESRLRQFEKDGKVFRGKIDADDTGVMQINAFFHEKTAEKLGHDIETLEGNLAYAKLLYEKQGTKPWNSSKSCWQNEIASN